MLRSQSSKNSHVAGYRHAYPLLRFRVAAQASHSASCRRRSSLDLCLRGLFEVCEVFLDIGADDADDEAAGSDVAAAAVAWAGAAATGASGTAGPAGVGSRDELEELAAVLRTAAVPSRPTGAATPWPPSPLGYAGSSSRGECCRWFRLCGCSRWLSSWRRCQPRRRARGSRGVHGVRQVCLGLSSGGIPHLHALLSSPLLMGDSSLLDLLVGCPSLRSVLPRCAASARLDVLPWRGFAVASPLPLPPIGPTAANPPAVRSYC